MALLIEQTSRDVPALRTAIGAERTRVVVRPGDSFRFIDDAGQVVKVPRLQVRRLDNNLLIDGFPDGQIVELNNFFGACRPGAECSVALDGLGAPPGTAITEETPPVSALSDGSFLLYATSSDAQLAAALPLATASAAQASGPSAGVIGAVGGGLLLAGAAGAAGGGGGDSAPPVDTTPPGAPVVTSKGLTNDRTPVITGEAEAGARITLRIDVNGNGVFTDTADATFSTTADANGRWSIDAGTAPQFGTLPPGGLADASYAILVQATDTAGNVSPSTRTTLAVDATPPAVPTIAVVEGNDVVNAVERADGVTITGNAEAGATVRVTWGATVVTTTASASGTYAAVFSAAQVPPDGLTQVQVVATDAAGNESALGSRPNVLIDATPPIAPAITSAAITNLTRPTVSGFAEAGSQVTLAVDAAGNGSVDAVYVTTAAANGTWSVNLATATPTSGSIGAGLADGSTNGLTASATDAAANASIATVASLRIDTSIPAAPTIAAVETDDIVNIAERADGVVVSGTIGEAGRPVTVTWGTTTRVVTAVGTGWTAAFAAGEVPPDGVSTLRASYVNSAGTPSVEGTRNVTVDLIAPAGPVVTDTVPGTAPTGPITFTFTFAEPVTGFSATDIVTTATVTGFTALSPSVYTALLTPPAGAVGSFTVDVAAGAALDLAGNPSLAATQVSQAYDTVAPTVVITDPVPGTTTAPVTFTFTFSEPVTGFSATDIVTAATVSGFTAVSTTVYTAVLTPPAGSGAFTVDVAAGAAVDLTGNPSLAATQVSQAYDTLAPTVAITDPVPGATGAPVTFTFTFSEPVTGFTAGDIITTATVTGFTALSQSVYTAVLTPPAGAVGSFTVDVGAGAALDLAGNPSLAATQVSQAYDTVAPTVVITDPVPGTTTAPVTFTFTFSEPVTGFSATDIVTAATVSGFTAVSTTVYTAVLTPPAGSGTFTVDVAAGAAADAVGNPSVAAAQVSQAFAPGDLVPPTLLITDDAPGVAGGPVTFTFTWSEPLAASGPGAFTLADIGVAGNSGGATLTGFSGSGATYTATYSPAAGTTGTLVLTVAAGVVTDVAGNPSTAAASTSQVYDRVPPTVAITDSVPGSTATNGPVTFTFTTSEVVTDFDATDVNVSPGGSITTAFAQTGPTTYTLTATPPPNDLASFTVSVAAGRFTDAAGNVNTAGATATQPYDTLAPTQTVTASSLVDNGVGPANAGAPAAIAPGGTTTDATPRFTLTLSAVLGTGESVVLQRDGATVSTFVSGGTLAFQEPTVGPPLAGTYTYTASILDSLGNAAVLDLTPLDAGTGYVFTII